MKIVKYVLSLFAGLGFGGGKRTARKVDPRAAWTQTAKGRKILSRNRKAYLSSLKKKTWSAEARLKASRRMTETWEKRRAVVPVVDVEAVAV